MRCGTFSPDAYHGVCVDEPRRVRVRIRRIASLQFTLLRYPEIAVRDVQENIIEPLWPTWVFIHFETGENSGKLLVDRWSKLCR